MEFIIALIVFILAFIGLAIGVILYNRRIKGSCGGLGAIMGKDCADCDCKKGISNDEQGMSNYEGRKTDE